MAAAGGIERVIAKHIEFLSKQHQIILVTKDFEKPFYCLPGTVQHSSLRVNFNLNMRSKIQRVIKIATTFMDTRQRLRAKLFEVNPDIIYVASPLGLLEVFSSQFTCKNVLVTEHSAFTSYNWIYKVIIRILYNKVSLLTVPTQADSALYSKLGIANTYLPNPLTFYPRSSSSLENKIVLNVGRLTDDKQHDLLIKIWSLSKGNDLGWKLKIIGQGENYQKLITLIQELKLVGSVEILPNTKKIEDEFKLASIFALTSRNEGFGLVLTEAMACGVPCIAFNCPSGPKDIISNAQSGYLIDEGNNVSFVEHLNMLMEDEVLRHSLGNQAKLDVMQFEGTKIGRSFNILIDTYFSSQGSDL
jgi:glycosyltransferase involved in cell wall biosynthesis